MINFLVGVVFGIVISTVGLSGIARVVDKGIDQTKSVIQEQSK
jgi:hypothetical protein